MPDRFFDGIFTDWLRRMPPWLISLGLHGCVVLALALGQFTFTAREGVDPWGPELSMRQMIRRDDWGEMERVRNCGLETQDDPSHDRSEPPPRITLFQERHDESHEGLMHEQGEYELCFGRESDIVLVFRITIPNLMNDRAYRLPLRLRNAEEAPLFHCPSWNGDGKGCYYGVNFDSMEATESSLNLSLHLYWKAIDRTRDSLEQSLSITIGKPSSIDLERNIKVRWTFEDPPKAGNVIEKAAR